MPKKPSAKSADPSFMSVPAFWPMAMAAQLFEEGAELYAKMLQKRYGHAKEQAERELERWAKELK